MTDTRHFPSCISVDRETPTSPFLRLVARWRRRLFGGGCNRAARARGGTRRAGGGQAGGGRSAGLHEGREAAARDLLLQVPRQREEEGRVGAGFHSRVARPEDVGTCARKLAHEGDAARRRGQAAIAGRAREDHEVDRSHRVRGRSRPSRSGPRHHPPAQPRRIQQHHPRPGRRRFPAGGRFSGGRFRLRL